MSAYGAEAEAVELVEAALGVVELLVVLEVVGALESAIIFKPFVYLCKYK